MAVSMTVISRGLEIIGVRAALEQASNTCSVCGRKRQRLWKVRHDRKR